MEKKGEGKKKKKDKKHQKKKTAEAPLEAGLLGYDSQVLPRS